MRPECLECVLKHLQKASVVCAEVLTGYPLHVHVVAGNLDEASEEAMRYSVELANKYRNVRLHMMAGYWAYRAGLIAADAFVKDHMPDIMALLEEVENLIVTQRMAEAVEQKGGKPKK